MKIIKFTLVAFVLAAIFALISRADPFVLDPGTTTGTTPIPVLVDTNGLITVPANHTLNIPTLLGTNLHFGYGKDGTSVRSGSGIFGGVTNAGAPVSIIDAAGNANGMFSVLKAGSGAGSGPVFSINNDKSVNAHGDIMIDNATNSRPDLYITHKTSNTTNAFEIIRDNGAAIFKIGNNNAITHNGSMTMSNFLFVTAPLTVTGVITVGQTNDISSSPSAPIAWLTVSSTNGTTYKLGLYAQ